jgi:hypothetical protein
MELGSVKPTTQNVVQRNVSHVNLIYFGSRENRINA